MPPLAAVSMPTPISTPEPERHRGRPSLTDEEREARRLARNQARREQRKAARAAAVAPPPPIVEPLPPPPPPPVEAAPPAPPRIYFALGRRARALLGFGLGAFVPLASYTEIHMEVGKHPALWFLVAEASNCVHRSQVNHSDRPL